MTSINRRSASYRSTPINHSAHAPAPKLEPKPKPKPKPKLKPKPKPNNTLNEVFENHPFLRQLVHDHPEFTWRTGKKFAFHPPKTIILGPPTPNYALLALHELGHALCKHKDYKTSIERLKIERAAWEKAKTVYLRYQKSRPDLLPDPWDIDADDFVESQLDTYRDWLHVKSKCPHCGLTRFQTPDGLYHCPHCDLFT